MKRHRVGKAERNGLPRMLLDFSIDHPCLSGIKCEGRALTMSKRSRIINIRETQPCGNMADAVAVIGIVKCTEGLWPKDD